MDNGPAKPSPYDAGAAANFPMLDVVDKVAFITGGASGIGRGIATAFAAAGMKIAIADCNRAHLHEAATRLKAGGAHIHPILVDVSDRDSMEAAAAETESVFGRIHVLVNNAGIQNGSPLSTMSYDDWDKMMAVNLHGVFNGVHSFVPRIRRHGEGGQVITTASIHGFFVASNGGSAAYCAAKFATVAMMESLRSELSDLNIGVSILCPGLVRTNLQDFLKEFPAASDPRDIGERVLQGMRKNQLYILTHPEFDVVIQARHDAIMSSSATDSHPGDERVAIAQSLLQHSIYLTQRIRDVPEA